MNVAGEILQHKNKKALFIASYLTIHCFFVCKLRQTGEVGDMIKAY
jgi:hypothetical protein